MTPEQELAEWRQRGSRISDQVCEKGEAILERGGLKRMKDNDVWPFLEQLAIAALDCGKIELAKVCIERLDNRFPDSPRVLPLKGMLLEANGNINEARLFYENALREDETLMAVRKRLITLHLNARPAPATNGKGKGVVATAPKSAQPATPLSVEQGIELLVEHLDTVYSDVEGWQQLADTYASLGLYEQSLSCLGDLILIQPHSSFWQLRYAETAYTIGDYALAYRSYLRTVELAGPMTPGGLARRAALGVKLCLHKLNNLTTVGESTTALPLHAEAIDALLTKDLVDVYNREWTGYGDAAAGHAESKAVKTWLASLSSSAGPVVR